MTKCDMNRNRGQQKIQTVHFLLRSRNSGRMPFHQDRTAVDVNNHSRHPYQVATNTSMSY
eukprot:scaffold35852_cov25-Prasinocladus_malaysianus.AAC.1